MIFHVNFAFRKKKQLGIACFNYSFAAWLRRKRERGAGRQAALQPLLYCVSGKRYGAAASAWLFSLLSIQR
jgi:hypothetical protein